MKLPIIPVPPPPVPTPHCGTPKIFCLPTGSPPITCACATLAQARYPGAKELFKAKFVSPPAHTGHNEGAPALDCPVPFNFKNVATLEFIPSVLRISNNCLISAIGSIIDFHCL